MSENDSEGGDEVSVEDTVRFLARISIVQGRSQFLRLKTSFHCWRKAWKKDMELIDESPVPQRICSVDVEFDEIDIKTIKAWEKLFKYKKTLTTWSNEDALRKAFEVMKNLPECSKPANIPHSVRLIFTKYESHLWILYCNYCENKKLAGIASNNLTFEQKISKKILDNERLWFLLRDFNICPGVCSKVMLNIFIQELSSISPYTSPLSSPSGSPAKLDVFGGFTFATTAMPTAAPKHYLSFKGFQKLLWKISLECLELSTTTTAQDRILFLLNRIDSSDGRKAMTKFIGAKALPFFKIKM